MHETHGIERNRPVLAGMSRGLPFPFSAKMDEHGHTATSQLSQHIRP
jgi:hypothetical protein